MIFQPGYWHAIFALFKRRWWTIPLLLLALYPAARLPALGGVLTGAAWCAAFIWLVEYRAPLWRIGLICALVIGLFAIEGGSPIAATALRQLALIAILGLLAPRAAHAANRGQIMAHMVILGFILPAIPAALVSLIALLLPYSETLIAAVFFTFVTTLLLADKVLLFVAATALTYAARPNLQDANQNLGK